MFPSFSSPASSGGPADFLRSARRNLVLLSAVAVLGSVLAAAMGIVASSWVLQALREADTAARALRLHTEADMMHDMMRADLFARAAGTAGAEEEFEEHVREMEQALEKLGRLDLPADLHATIEQERRQLAEYTGAGRRLMAQREPISLGQLEAYSTLWRDMEEPLDRTRDALEALVARAEEAGERGRANAIGWGAGALLLLLAAIGLAVRRLSGNVLDANRQLLEAMKQAVQANQSRGDFLASMSHEIRTPMTGVLGMVDLLAQENVSPQQRRAYVEALRGSGQHLLAIINDILDFTRIESGRLQLEQLDFSLRELLEQLRSLVNPLAIERGLCFEVVPPERTPVLRGDPTRIRQVLLNLASNAVKFTERGSVKVRVDARPQDTGRWRARFEVRDTGVGISQEAMAELFTPFRQADRSIARRFGGSGLGLAICRRLVEAMGGEIGVDSTPGTGSVFFFELTLPEGDERNLAAAAERPPLAARPRRILVAEDVEINRQLLKTGLERAGHIPVFAGDGAEAVRLAEAEPFDLVLMDVQMPVMDGMEATRRIRQLANGNRSVPILALTANVMAQERDAYLAAGMDACLMKPIDWDQLFAAIEQQARAPAREAGAGGPQQALPPIVDDATHASLAELASREHLAEWMQAGLRAYGEALAGMAGADPQRIAVEAHKIKGSAGTLGLPRLHSFAAALEQAARAGEATPAQLERLVQALAQTREALHERGLLQADAA